MSQKDVPVYTKIFDYPLLVKLWLSPIFQPLAIKALSSWAAAHKGTISAESKEAEDFAVKIGLMATDQITKHSGYFRALINTAKDYPLIGLDDRYKKVGQSNTPVYALWGDADVVSFQMAVEYFDNKDERRHVTLIIFFKQTVPFRHSQTLLQYIPHAKLFVYEGGGHNILMTNPEKAHQDLLSILENRA
jgi:pimeloyl-ACP methyl ester carboxylesterase